jgi:rSAM/selenodomain-associated transferase 2
MMQLSVVMPTLNEAAGIVPALKALAPLRAAGAEVLLVDGGSHDATATLARPWVDRLLVAPPGRARQMNAGAAAAHGENLLFLHADTRLPEDAPRLIGQALAGNSVWGRFDVRIDGRPVLLRAVAALMNLRSRWTGIATGDQAMFVSRAAFDAVGGFPDIGLMEDIVLSRRLRQLSRPACLGARVVTSGRRWERSGLMRTILTMWWLRLRFFFGANPAKLAKAYDHVSGET